MREILSVIINPIPVFFILILTGIILFIYKRQKAGKALLFLAVFWFLAVTTPPLPRYLVWSLEKKYCQLPDSSFRAISSPCNIIILGGGHSDDNTLSPNNQLSLIALSRLVEGIRIQRLIAGSKLILSGYDRKSKQSEAMVYYKAALSLGVDSNYMVLQSLPSNTKMEAEEYVKNFGIGTKLILVTSAIHMPRAVMHFQNAGIKPTPAPSNFILKEEYVKYPLNWIPSPRNLSMMEAAIHEKTGILWAKLSNW
jgi:uncharacterized SAM-binding protein YcdF (DUF218 family)